MRRKPREGTRGAAWIAPVVVALVTFVAFLPALTSGFVTWDDDKNFLNNVHYRGLGWSQLGWMWTTVHMGHYVPLSWMTLGLDYVVWGMNPAGYHLTNVLLHCANAVALYFLSRRILRLTSAFSGDNDRLVVASAFAALLFALHPMRVESVVWVTERRDVLSLLFYLTATLSYLRYCEERPARWRYYLLALGLFACALLSKATAMTLPAVLLILNVYPLRRLDSTTRWRSKPFRRVIAELAPFALLTGVTVVSSIVALKPPGQLTPWGKLAVSSYSLSFYLLKTIVPTKLSPLYEMPQRVHPLEARFVASYAAALVLAAIVWAIRRRSPGATTACLLFLVIVLPMLGVVQNGPQIAADRYTYFAMPALAILAGASFLLVTPPRALVLDGIGAVVLVVLATLTWNQTLIWHDSRRFWSYVLSLDAESSSAHNALAGLLLKEGKADEAIDHYRHAVAIDTTFPDGHNNLGVALVRQGRNAEAIIEYQRALAIKPRYAEAHNNWGASVARAGDLPSAIDHYQMALAIDPELADAHVNWGNALVRLRRLDEAIVHYRAALALRPDDADAYHNWGVALAQQGKLDDAIELFRKALALQPDHAEAAQYLERATQLQRSMTR